MNANKIAPDCPLCGHEIFIGNYYGWFSLATHVADKHGRPKNASSDNMPGCPCGFRGLIHSAWPPTNNSCLMKHLYDQPDVEVHLVLAAVANVGSEQ